MFKKLLNLAVLTAMVATLIPMTAFAATGVTVNTLTTTDTTPTLTGTMTASVSGDVVNVTVGGHTYSAIENYVANTWTADVTDVLAVATYDVVVTVTNGAGTASDATTNELIVNAPLPTLTISTFTITPATEFDPSPKGGNDDLVVAYSIAEVPTSVSVEIIDANSQSVKNFSSALQATSFSWNGEYSGDLIEPGTYTALIVVKKTGYTDATQSKTFVVEYNDSDKPTISDFTVSPDSFDPDEDTTTIEFTNEEDATLLTVEIRDSNGNKVRGFSNYTNDEFDANENHSIDWDGLDDDDDQVDIGTYKAVVIARNDYGVTVESETITITNDGSSGTDYPSSNVQISGIDFNPSSTFEPANDDELEIEFDVLKDNLDLTVYATKGSTEVEIYDDSNLDKDNNVQITWDGTDEDGDYVVAGTWDIEFHSEVDGTDLVAAKSIKVQYDKAQISNIYVSKDKFDNDLNEFTYVMFKVDADALVDVNILEDGDEDDTLEEDIEVEKNGWYAVQFDGGNYDYGDDLEIEVVAKNKANEDEDDTAKITIDLARDSVSNGKPNIINDYMDPVLTDGDTEMSLSYELEEKADVTVTIHKGKSSSGTTMIELLDVKNQAAGEHTITWDGQDDDGDDLADGVYTYKIISKKSSTDTEIGYFIVGNVGDEITTSSSHNSGSSSNNGKIAPGVIVDGKGTFSGTTGAKCSNFSDVLASSPSCEAIIWAKNEGIFQGYLDGTFKPYQTINRAQMLKVALLSTGTTVNLWDYSTIGLGFTDLTAGSWYIPFIKGASLLGIFSGDGGSNTARPTADVNRGEVLKFIFESLRVSRNYQLNSCSSSFTDVYPTNWYFKYACAAKTYSLFTSGTVLSPNTSATRSEVASVLYKLHTAGLL